MNPFLEKKSYKAGEKALTKAQVEKLLSVIDNIGDLALITLTIDVGLRREDVVNIRRRDVNLEKREITFFERKKNRTRIEAVGQRTAQVLEMWLRINKSSQWLFPSRHIRTFRGHMSSKTAYNILNRHLLRAGLPHRPFHALRATCYKLCQQAGWSVEQAAKRLGDSVSIAQEHYATPSDEEIKSLVEKKQII